MKNSNLFYGSLAASVILISSIIVLRLTYVRIKDSHQENEIILNTGEVKLHGIFTVPKKDIVAIALIIAGSGPTDKNGNGPHLQSNSLKMLCEELSHHGIASVRYDKRGIQAMNGGETVDPTLTFEHYVEDVREWIKLLKHESKFAKIVIIGHSQGSLIGMLGSEDADLFISLSGSGRSVDKTIRDQLTAQSEEIQHLNFPVLDELSQGRLVLEASPSIFLKPSVQPYLISWMKFNPEIEIKKLTIPILIIQGTNDIQLTVEDAKLLFNAVSNNKKSELVIIKNMNHILKIIDSTDRKENIQSYGDPDLPISTELINSIVKFVLKN